MQNNTIHVRPATATDAETIAAFNGAMAVETEGRQLGAETLLRGVQAVLADGSKGAYYLAQRGEVAVGQMLITTEWSDWRAGLFWWIQSVYVRPEDRGAGVYRALHDSIERLARTTPGVCGLRLYVDAHNTAAQQVYRQMGMTQTNYLLFETDWSGPAG